MSLPLLVELCREIPGSSTISTISPPVIHRISSPQPRGGDVLVWSLLAPCAIGCEAEPRRQHRGRDLRLHGPGAIPREAFPTTDLYLGGHCCRLLSRRPSTLSYQQERSGKRRLRSPLASELLRSAAQDPRERPPSAAALGPLCGPPVDSETRPTGRDPPHEERPAHEGETRPTRGETRPTRRDPPHRGETRPTRGRSDGVSEPRP